MKRSFSVSRPVTTVGRTKRANSENIRAAVSHSTNDDGSLMVLEANTSAVLPPPASRSQDQQLQHVSKDDSPSIIYIDNDGEDNSEVTKAVLLALDKKKGMECLKVMRSYMATCWWFLQPLLFCLIGADIPVEKLRADTIGGSVA